MKIVFNPKTYYKKAQQLLYKGARLTQQATATPDLLSPPQTIRDSVDVAWFPQDPLADSVETTILPDPRVQAADDPAGLSAPRFRIIDPNNPPAQPGQTYPVGDPRFDQLMALTVGEKVLNMDEQALGRTIPWGFGQPQLWIYVHKDEEPNSGYTRGDPTSKNVNQQHGRVELDYFTDGLTGQVVQASESSDITAHECTHAITDGVRDLYLFSFNPDSQAFHEGNADIGAVRLALQNPSVVKQVIQATGGNLRKDNMLSDIGEQFGQAMVDDSMSLPTLTPYIRDVNNDPKTFSDTNWRTLPFIDPNDGLGSEPHSYSRIWSGAWYDSLVGIYNMLQHDYGMEPDDALYQAGHVMNDVAMRALEFAPIGDMRFHEMGIAYLKAVKTDFGTGEIGSKYGACIEKAFLNRGILNPQQISDWNTMEKKLPDLSLEPGINDAKTAQAWLQKNASTLTQFDPDLAGYLSKLQFKNIYGNRLGETFLNFSYRQTATLQDSDFNDPSLSPFKGEFSGTNFDVWGGITLGFDRTGKLFAYTHDTVPQSEISDDKAYILTLIAQGLIQGSGNRIQNPGWPDASHHKAIHIRGVVVNQDGKRYFRRIQTMA